MAASLAIGVRTAFMVLGCLMTASLIYTLATDGLPFRKQLLTPWIAATLIDLYINILIIAVWVMYKEANWIQSIIWIILLICLGSITTCAYIVLQFLKLSPQESAQDPIYFVLLRNRKSARILFSILGSLMLATLVYFLVTAGSPFRPENFTPWFSATLIDFYVHIFALLVWVAYKESNWTTSTIWIILFICFGSICTCAYIVLQLFHLSPQDPTFLVLFSGNRARAVNGYEETLHT